MIALFAVCGCALHAAGGETGARYAQRKIKVTVEIVSDRDGASLKAAGDGLVFLKFENTGHDKVEIPLIAWYESAPEGKPRASYASGRMSGFAGFEAATVRYAFLDADGNEVFAGTALIPGGGRARLLPQPVDVYHGEDILIFSVKAPEKGGVYGLRLLFDNINVEKALTTKDSGDTRLYFTRELVLKEIPVK